jgi:signal transduction histidine kinase
VDLGGSEDEVIQARTSHTSASDYLRTRSDQTSENAASGHGRTPASDHFAQFYETDTFLIDTLTEYLASGLRSGETVLAIATPAHRHALDARLRTMGLDLDEATSSGHYFAVDAQTMLATFMVGNRPNAERLRGSVAPWLATAAEHNRPVRAFGEMVALLWAEGNRAGALELEACWNELQQHHAFTLFCAYPLADFDVDAAGGLLDDVCSAHSHVIPAESYTSLTESATQTRTIVSLQQKARRLERALSQEQQARAEAERVNRVKDEFLSTLAHELRTPLAIMLGWIQRLRQRSNDVACVERGLEILEHQTKAQTHMIDGMLDLSEIVTGHFQVQQQQIKLAGVIDDAVASVRLAAVNKHITIEVDTDRSGMSLVGDADRLRQVFWNLLANAVKFTPPHGRITVALARRGTRAEIAVSDTGEGIRPDFLPYVFSAFLQADGTSTRRHGGLGLGLALTRHLVELHGGSIQAYSAGEGKGATFTILLPLAAEP